MCTYGGAIPPHQCAVPAQQTPDSSPALAPNSCYSINTGANMRRRQFIILLGGAAVWPALGQAQQPTVTTIGFMSGRALKNSKHLLAAFHQGLGEAGFVEGKNVAVEYRWALGQYDRLPALATDLVNRRVAVLAAVGGDPSPLAAKQATSTIPVVFGMGSDPIKAGLVESISRPNSNMTGLTLLTNELEPKRLGILRDLLPGLSVVGVLLNPNFPPAVGQVLALENAARKRPVNGSLYLEPAMTRNWSRVWRRSSSREPARCLLQRTHTSTQSVTGWLRSRQNKLPAIYQFREFAVAGGLISYGPSITDSVPARGRLRRTNPQRREAG